ncbi:helix-turn-helix type 11 domain protein [Syntrophobotulus glycolicus DSM 8271]|uniref:Helix-turn-helix type 11 domain protein n=1 Tax=Syntrophobotulus glycolicus (strain DSM 8271 / FlGlyR) TaxID=645991 RepID=F0SVB3_SYNGF|nr:YafY family protein [Syntrophobotulus glycolicus]ADY55613.1 helix-turn-helix type 11 domain protein [Syntrophobotulus glycolicus DSM 8271]
MQINRFFELIYILLEKHTVTAVEFAERFEVSVRTIYRDVEMLSRAGVPIYMRKGRGGGISLLPGFVLNKTFLTEEEKSEILSSMRAFDAVSLANNKTALDKLSSMLGGQNTDWIEVDFSSWGYFENEAKYFSMLKTAIIEKYVVTFLYASGKAEKLPREVMPLKMAFKGAAWYLYGFCTMRKDYRFFKLRRITELFVTQKRFEMKAPVKVLENQKFDSTFFIKTKMLISKEMAFRVYDEMSHYELTETGDFICELYLPDISTACTYAASFGEHCTILSPDEAISKLKRRLENSLNHYL